MLNEIIKNLDINDYHKIPGLSNSGLKLLLDCPKRYYTEYLDPHKPKQDKEKHFALGTAVHSLVLEPDRFFQDNYVMPKVDRRTNNGKEIYAACVNEAGRRNLINDEDFIQAKGMADSLFNELTWLKPALKGAGIEESFFWEDSDTGVQLKSRPDAYNEDFYIDIKTTASIKDFHKSLYNYGYHTQAALAREALLKLTGVKYSHFLYAVVEEAYPYMSAAFVIDEDSLTKGYNDFKRGAEIYKRCLDANTWPGYGSAVQQIYLPAWLS